MRTDSVCDGGNYVKGKCPTQPINVKCCVRNNGDGEVVNGGGGTDNGGGFTNNGGGNGEDKFEYDFATR